MLRIEPTSTEWSLPVIIVPNSDGGDAFASIIGD